MSEGGGWAAMRDRRMRRWMASDSIVCASYQYHNQRLPVAEGYGAPLLIFLALDQWQMSRIRRKRREQT